MHFISPILSHFIHRMHDINLLNLIALKEKQAFIKVRAIATNQTSVSIGAG